MRAALVVALLVALVSIGRADELVATEVAVSPDGKNRLEAKMWLAPRASDPRIEIVMTRAGEKIFERTIPPESEVRYVKLAWSPKSGAALVGLNQKASEDLLFLQVDDREVTANVFDGDKRIIQRMLETVPFREDLKSNAPVARFPWKTVKWPSAGKCTVTFILDGIGYLATAQARIEYGGRDEPRFIVTSLEPGVDRALWEQD